MRYATIVLAALIGLSSSACPNRLNVQCVENSNCDLYSGGVCATTGTGNHWCSYPDAACSSGYRYSTLDVGDGVSGTCVTPSDAGTIIVPLPSCMALPHTCGALNNDDCCRTLTVPGGTYFRSYDVARDPSSGDKSALATISSFQLDKYDVTVARFRAFVAEGMGTQAKPPTTGTGAHPLIPGTGWETSWNGSLQANTGQLVAAIQCDSMSQTWTGTAAGNDDRPINCVNWYEAMAFCAWDGGRLPTEAEWNYTAAGGEDQRAYPWSMPPGALDLDSSHAGYWDGTTCNGDGKPGCQTTDLVFVGSKPASDGRWGHSDLVGNVYNWVLDWWGPYVTHVWTARIS